MFRKLALLAVIGVLATAAFASAAALDVTGGAIQAGQDVELRCDTSGVYVTGWGLETDVNQVTNVKLGGIDGACMGNDIFVKVTGTGGSTLYYSSATPVVSPNMTFNFGTPLAPEAIVDLHIWIEGPNGL